MVLQNHHEICAVFIEPLIQCAAGMKMYPGAYLKRLKELCTQFDIHLIADEIAVGFGRTGHMFACGHAGISPDIMCLSKALTAGYMPLSLVVTTDNIYQAFYSDYIEQKAFMHSHSYTGNPIACAIACESLDIFKDDDVLAKNDLKSKFIAEMVGGFAQNHPYVGEFRQMGMIGALELVEDKLSRKAFAWEKRVGYGIFKIALAKGVLSAPAGQCHLLHAPLCRGEKGYRAHGRRRNPVHSGILRGVNIPSPLGGEGQGEGVHERRLHAYCH